jgi:hypothetical protein
MSDSWLVAFLGRRMRPVAFLERSFQGVAKAELLFLLLFFVPKLAHLAWFVRVARDQWQEGMDSLYMLTTSTEVQYWVERLAMWFSVDFQIMVRNCSFSIQCIASNSSICGLFCSCCRFRPVLGGYMS